jgi:site-specific DNA recombinase
LLLLNTPPTTEYPWLKQCICGNIYTGQGKYSLLEAAIMEKQIKAAFLYRRVSSVMQVVAGVSLDAQLERLRQYAEQNNYQVMGEFADKGISGKKISNRPELNQCLDQACKTKGSTIICYSISRLSRSVKDMAFVSERLNKYGVQLISLTENIDTSTAAGKLTFQLFISLAEHERNLLGERVKSSLSKMKTDGKLTGNCPYGYSLAQDGKTLVWNEKEQAAIETMKTMRAAGKTYRAIGKELLAINMPPKTASEWSAGAIYRIMQNSVCERRVAA